MKIAVSVVSAILKSVVGDKLGSGLTKELIEISIDGISENGINEIIEFINTEKSKIDSILSKGNMRIIGISEDKIDYVVTEIKDLFSRIDITDDVLKQCRYDNKKLSVFLWNEYSKMKDGYIEYESEIKKSLFAVTKVLINLVRESENFEKDVLIHISNSVDDVNVELQKISEYMDNNIDKFDANNQTILQILQMILEQNKEESVRNKEKRQKINNRTQEYADKWNQNMFLNDFDKRDENAGVNVKLSEVYLDEHLPHYIWGNNDKVSDDLKKLLSEYVNEKKDNKMLLVLGQPGIGKSTLITWIAANFTDCIEDILIYKFASDLKNIDWINTNFEFSLVDRILTELDLSYEDLKDKTLIIDGFDEVSVGNDREKVLNNIYWQLIKGGSDGFSLVITCRENYIRRLDKLECRYITLQTWDENQIYSFNKIYQEKTKNDISEWTFKRAIDEKEVFGIPLILYMVLALNISIDQEGSIVDVYDKIFSLEGGIYDRCIDNKKFADNHRIGEVKEQIHQISREIALWMFENNSEEAVIPQNKYQKICSNIMQQIEKRYENERLDFLIGNYFKLVRHCEGIETEELSFVHRSIFEYFFVEFFCSNTIECISKNYDREDLGELSKKIACICGLFLKGNRLTINILDYMKRKIENSILNDNFSVINDAFQIMLNNGMTYYTEKCHKNAVICEMNVFANMLEILHLWNTEVIACNEKIVDYIQYNRDIELNLKKMNLKRANLRRANLAGVNLEGANLEETDLEEADLSQANLKNANLKNANLKNAVLDNTNLTGTNFYRTKLDDVNLKNAEINVEDINGAIYYGEIVRGEDVVGSDLLKEH